MNISSHTFVPTRKFVYLSSGNYNTFFDYYYDAGFPVKIFPYDNDTYSIRMKPSSSSFLISVNSLPGIPYLVNDTTVPKNFIFLLY